MTPLAQQGLRCIAYDLRGAGRSDQPGHGYDPDTWPATGRGDPAARPAPQ